MPRQSEIGAEADSVWITLNGERIAIYENYEVSCAILTQPAAFALRLGTGKTIAEMVKAYPPNTPFQLHIGDSLIQTGKTDGFDAISGGDSTQLTLRGRDTLAPLHDSFVLVEKSFSGVTYRQLTLEALASVGLIKKNGTKVDEADAKAKLASDDSANRLAIAGRKVAHEAYSAIVVDPATNEEVSVNKGPQVIDHTVYVHISDRWLDFLGERLGRAGLFLWAAADGTFVLSSPNPKAPPTYRITRRRGQTREETNVIQAHYRNDITRRYSICKVYTRGGGKKRGVALPSGEYVDEQIASVFGLGKEGKPLVIRDVDAKDRATAEFHARRRLAEAARGGWALGYSLAGHKAPTVGGGMATWTPNLMVEVDDEEFGIKGTYWIESVTYRRDPATVTEVVLMDPSHMVFGYSEGGA